MNVGHLFLNAILVDPPSGVVGLRSLMMLIAATVLNMGQSQP